MKNIFISLAIISVFIFSCGPSAEERAAHERMIADSVANAIKTKEMLQDSLKRLEALKVENENGLRKDEEDMNVANSQMASIQEWQLMRTSDEKESQIRRQTQNIQIIRDNTEIHKKNLIIIGERIEAVRTELLKYGER